MRLRRVRLFLAPACALVAHSLSVLCNTLLAFRPLPLISRLRSTCLPHCILAPALFLPAWLLAGDLSCSRIPPAVFSGRIRLCNPGFAYMPPFPLRLLPAITGFPCTNPGLSGLTSLLWSPWPAYASTLAVFILHLLASAFPMAPLPLAALPAIHPN